MGKFTDFITGRYTDGGAGINNLDFSNIAKDLGAATALYGVINPNDSSGLANFFGTGKQQQPVGYMGGIPNYTATRELAPNAFAPTYATPTGEVAARRPGMAGRRYFTDTTFEQSTDEPFMGVTAEQIAAQNQTAIDDQNLFESILGNVENQRIAGAATTGTTAATTGAATGTTFPEGTDGNGVVSNSVLDGFGEVVNGADTGTAADPNAAFNTFISPFYGQEQLTPAQLIQLGDSGYDLSTIASKLAVDPTALSNAIAQATSAAQTQSIFDAVDPSDGFSKDEAKSVANLILGGQIDIEGVANQFEGVSDMDVIEGMLRGGYETPAAMTERLTPANTGFTEVELMGILLSQGHTTPEELAGYYGNNPDYPEYAGITAADVRGFAKDLGIEGYAQGGNINGYYLGGPTDGMADRIPATIDNMQPAALSDGEFVIPADVVGHLGNGNSDAGAQNLYSMMERVRKDRTGNPEQGRQIDPNQYLA